ncbi:MULTISPECIES: S53 family peptidase [Oleiagrimonas]|uniref:S8/S53 family peptidase n=1 Tax=Oleiagrimonas citrea TaxID=1665687 RepID=A0A846ZJH2_9GAMM|nr:MULTISPECIES: S53 family peptidase [Oleiagrimonas]NKZ37952.1 S8/S53 family peptidase [Oleiagrimonas citrea]
MRMKKASLNLAMGAALALTAVVPAWAGSAHWAATNTHAHVLATGSKVHGAAALDTPVHVTIALKARNQAELQKLAATAHAPMSAQDVINEFAPTSAQVQSVVDYLKGQGFTNISVSANRMLVSADGDAARAQSAFNTSLVSVTTPHGRNAIANTSAAQVPSSIAGSVLSVIGLQTAARPHVMFKGKPGGGGSTTGTVTGHNPTEFPTIYNVGSTPAATSINVGIISDGDMSATLQDLNQFVTTNGLATPSVQVVYPGAQGTDTSGTAEWDLDSQDILAMSGGVNKLIFYAATSLSNSDLTAAFNKAVSDDQAQVVNVSLGECETSAYQDGSMAADDQILAMGVAQGQTFSISTGDSGSNECSGGGPKGTTPSYPASSPNVIAVSGTTLGTTSSGNWADETLWADAGGSPSTVEPKPSWQTQGDSMRDVADVAFDADPNSGSIIIVNGSNAQYGGTSLAAPLFAATWARMLASHPGLGFAGPHLYTVSTSVYHDVTSGSNGGETATAGWDFASGFGSINVSALNSSL